MFLERSRQQATPSRNDGGQESETVAGATGTAPNAYGWRRPIGAIPIMVSVPEIELFYHSWSTWKRFNTCRSLIAGGNVINGWDIEEIHKAKEAPWTYGCQTGKCKKTLMVDGDCHFQNGVNYVLWGKMGRLCGYSRASVISLAELWAPISSDSPEEAASKVAWALSGYEGWPHSAGPPTASHPDCESCVGKEPVPDRFFARWGGEKIPPR